MPAPPTFGARLTKTTGDGEQVEITLVADDADTLRKRLNTACDVATARMKKNNEGVLDAREEITRAQVQATQELRRERLKLEEAKAALDTATRLQPQLQPELKQALDGAKGEHGGGQDGAADRAALPSADS